MNIRPLHKISALVLALTLVASAAVTQTVARPSGSEATPAGSTFARDGVSVVLSMAAVDSQAVTGDGVESVDVRFRITDASTGEALTGLNPIAWLDRADPSQGCQAKIRSFLSGSLQARPEADLNTYRVIILNRGGTVSVIDPLLGFGGSKLITLVLLGGEGADWVLTTDQQTLFISLPLANEVVAVDTSTWKVTSRIAVGEQPGRLALQPDGARLWVATAGAKGGVSIIDVDARSEIGRVETSAGDHDLAFTRDSRFAFVTNRADGTLSVIDVRAKAEVRRMTTGAAPVSLAYSPLAGAAYVTHADGSVVSIDAESHKVRSRVATSDGLRSASVSPDGRWLFAVNGDKNLVYVIDASMDRVVQSITAGNLPDQVSFSDAFAYVRSTATGDVTLIRLSTVAAGQKPDLTIVPAGQIAPEYASASSLLPAIVPAPEKNAMLVSNPADRIVYYYSEGMAAPMGSFQNYRRVPMGVLAVRRNLREIEPGTYATTVQLRRGGRFEVPFLLDSPRLSHCFDHSFQLASARDETKKPGIRAERLFGRTTTVGTPAKVRVRLTNGPDGVPLRGVTDLRILTFTAGVFQKRAWAKEIGDGVYEATVTPPSAGAYYVFLESASLGRKYRDFPHWVVTATDAATSRRAEAKGATR